MEKLIESAKRLKDWQVLLLVLILPLPIAILLLGGSGALSSILDKWTRKRVDEKSSRIDQALEAYKSEIDKAEGRVDQMEKDKKTAVESAKDDNAESFHNKRKKDQ